MKAGKEHFGQHRTKSASTSFNIAESLWEHTPPLEGRGRAVRRKVNGRVTGWNPLSLREGEGAGGETGKKSNAPIKRSVEALPRRTTQKALSPIWGEGGSKICLNYFAFSTSIS